MDSNLQYKQNDFNSIAEKIDEVVGSINKAYHKDSSNELSEKELRKAVLDGTVPTSIAGNGAFASCGKSSVSDCGRYTLDNDPFIATGRKSDKIFLMALGNIAPADKVKHLPFSIRQPASDVHMVPGIKHNLLSMN